MSYITRKEAEQLFKAGEIIDFVDHKKGKVKSLSISRVAQLFDIPLSSVKFYNVIKYGCADMGEIEFRLNKK